LDLLNTNTLFFFCSFLLRRLLNPDKTDRGLRIVQSKQAALEKSTGDLCLEPRNAAAAESVYLQDAAANGGQNPFPKAENRNATTFYKISALDCKQKCTETGCNNCTVTVLREPSLVQHPATSEEEEEANAALVVVILLHSTHFPPLHKNTTIKHHRLQAANLASPRQLLIHRNKSSQKQPKIPKKNPGAAALSFILQRKREQEEHEQEEEAEGEEQEQGTKTKQVNTKTMAKTQAINPG